MKLTLQEKADIEQQFKVPLSSLAADTDQDYT